MDWISGWCRSNRKLHGVTVIVTGSNTGLGKETAKDLYSRGARVIMACRDTKKAEQAASDIEATAAESRGTLLVVELDLSRLVSVRRFAGIVLASEPKIHILVNNAGVMMCPESRSEDGLEMHLATNHVGHAALALLLLPRLRASAPAPRPAPAPAPAAAPAPAPAAAPAPAPAAAPGPAPARVVFVSSFVHKAYDLDFEDLNFETTKYDPKIAYCRSKAANILFSRALANKLKEHGITSVSTYSLHPGVVATEISRHFSVTYLRGATGLFGGCGWLMKSLRCGAQTALHCALDDAAAGESGLYYSDCAVAQPSPQCRSDAAAARLWDLTLPMLRLRGFDPFGDADPGPDCLNTH